MTDVPRETALKLERLRALVLAENRVQNLISAASVTMIDERHFADSLQLLPFIDNGDVLDIGSGAGFPGLVLACCRPDPVHLVEPRKKRAEFLSRMVEELGLAATRVWASKVEAVQLPVVQVITARAVASLTALFEAAHHLADQETRWVLPKGRSAQSELDTARLSWQGEFKLVPSVTDPEARIVLARGVHRRRAA